MHHLVRYNQKTTFLTKFVPVDILLMKAKSLSIMGSKATLQAFPEFQGMCWAGRKVPISFV